MFKRQFCPILLTAGLAFLARPARTEIIAASNSVWAYFKGTSEASSPLDAWRTNTFDDSSWLRGAAPFYYGTTPSGTNLSCNTLLSDMHSNYT